MVVPITSTGVSIIQFFQSQMTTIPSGLSFPPQATQYAALQIAPDASTLPNLIWNLSGMTDSPSAGASDNITFSLWSGLLDIPSVVNGNNYTFTYQFGFLSNVTYIVDTLYIIEPFFNVTVTSNVSSAAYGDQITFTVVVAHSNVSTAPGYNLALNLVTDKLSINSLSSNSNSSILSSSSTTANLALYNSSLGNTWTTTVSIYYANDELNSLTI